jgi:hypothetical protein
MEESRTPGGPSTPSHWIDLKPKGILKTDATVAAKKDVINRHILDRQRNEVILKILVLGSPRTVSTIVPPGLWPNLRYGLLLIYT